MKRTDNIKFLKGLLRGEGHISEIRPSKVILLSKFSDQNHYTEGHGKKIWSEKMFKTIRKVDRMTE